MEDRDFRSWNITPDQADRIKAGDIQERNDFYLKNRKRFFAMAENYSKLHNRYNTFYHYDKEELVSQLYLDLPYLNWQNALQLTMSIKQVSFAWCAYGGYAQRKEQGLPCSHKYQPWEWVPDTSSLDVPIFDEDEPASLIDVIFSLDLNPCQVLLAKENQVKALKLEEIMNVVKYHLSDRHSEIFKLYLQGFTFSEISEHVERGGDALYSILDKICFHYQDILTKIYKDRQLPHVLQNVVPERYEAVKKKIDDENARRRARKREKALAEGRTLRAPRRTFATEEERQAAIRENKRKYEERKRLNPEARIYKKEKTS